MWLNKVKKFFLDLFFPKKCLGCGHPDTYLCRDCFTRIQIIDNNICFFCGKISWKGKICIECAKENGLDRIVSATEYKNPLIRDLIKAFKYHFVQELAEPLSKLLIKSLETLDFKLLTLNFLIIPVPLHGSRMRYRGFNQAELLAKEVADYFKLPLETDILKRKISTTPQAKIKNTEKRRVNLENVFEVNPELVEGKIVILLDDVTTTGATLIEAAKVLKNSGAKEVWGLVVAKG
jgi:ComF family protein